MAENEMNDVVVEETTQVTEPSIADLQAQIQELTAEKDKLKQAISASNSDASKRKKEAQEWQEKYKSTLDEQKRKEFEAEETMKQMTSELASFKERERISSYKSKLMSAGYDESTAGTMASALPEGIEDSFFESQRSFIEATKQQIKEQTINSQPNLSTGMPPSTTPSIESEDDKLKKWFGL